MNWMKKSDLVLITQPQKVKIHPWYCFNWSSQASFCSRLAANQARGVRNHFPQLPGAWHSQSDPEDAAWFLYQVSFKRFSEEKREKSLNLKLVQHSHVYTCSVIPYVNTSLVQEWSPGRHAGDPQESSECEALRHGRHVPVVPGEERLSLSFDVLSQTTHTHTFHHIDNCCSTFLPPSA